jgi:hypothetical protein
VIAACTKEEKSMTAKVFLGHVFDKLTQFDLLIDELYLQIDTYKQEISLMQTEELPEQLASLEEYKLLLHSLSEKKNIIVESLDNDISTNIEI